jgi:dTDP-4-amino-4,6-dideoxygalactose transaminase
MSRERIAIDGGTPLRDAFLPFARPSLGPEEEAAVIEVLRSGWLGTGPRTERFEAVFASYVGTAKAVGVASCTAGLHLALRAFDVGPGDEVVTSAMTFPSTANAVFHAGATPVLADVLPDSLGLDPQSVEQAIGASTRAIVAVHFAGWPCAMDEIRAVARRAGVPVIEDAAHALGAIYRGRAAGALGDAGVFSFYASKNITTGEGGMITTDRVDLVPRLQRERLHGVDVDVSRRAGDHYEHWEAVSLGWKYNLTDIAAALGIVQMQKLPAFLKERRLQDARYRRLLGDLPVDPLHGPDGAETSAHLFPVLFRPGTLRVDRDTVLQAMLAERIGVAVHFRALPLHRYLRETLSLDPQDFPVACDASARVLSLPIYPGLSERDQADVVEALARVLRYYAS